MSFLAITTPYLRLHGRLENKRLITPHDIAYIGSTDLLYCGPMDNAVLVNPISDALGPLTVLLFCVCRFKW